MKDALLGLAVILTALVIVVAGYYVGIVVAVLGAILLAIGIVLGVLSLTVVAVYDVYKTWQERRRQQRSR